MFNGIKIDNGSALSIDLIGINEMALICKTNKSDCCASHHIRHGEWYYNGSNILNEGTSMISFYRDRTDNSEVRLNKRNSDVQVTPDSGMYCCEIPESDANCGIIQKLCINLGEYSNCISELPILLRNNAYSYLLCSISCDQRTWK